ncbi:MAG: response regulator transcription factor [Kiritimatiellaceae bacterium]|nr:response regulator transcription factor [Kiritimatiellaceae bacterium]
MKILLIEDSIRLQDSIRLALKKSDYAVDVASDGEQGFWLASTVPYDVIILDLMLPKMDGLTVLSRLREENIDTHVLILTAKDAVPDRIRGLNTGADDYLTKPFSIDELLARVAALVRRSYGNKNPELRCGNLVLDLKRQEFRIQEQILPLAPREFKVLNLLVHRADTLTDRSEIEAHIYEETSDIFSNVIDATISILRRKMADAGCTVKIVTRRGLGYLLEAQSE